MSMKQLGQFTRNYKQTEKRAADNKRSYARFARCIAPVYCSDFGEMQPHGISVWVGVSEKSGGVPKGGSRPLWHTTFGTKV